MTRYATSTDPRGYIPVFEYPLNGQYIMIDCETGMVHFTGIWKALGHTKADVVKLVESDPTIAPYLRKVRGGYLKIQGTWLPFETARTLARRVAWQVRYDLIPLFGPEFPDTCLGPGEPGFGQLLLSAPKPRGRRGTKKGGTALVAPPSEKSTAPSQNGSCHPSTHSGQDSSSSRHPVRPETGGSIPGYGTSISQPRYSPYARVPSHGITQLEPLPSLIQPNHGRPHSLDSMYQSQYPPGLRSSIISSNGGASSHYGHALSGPQVNANRPTPSLGSTAQGHPLPNYQPQSASQNNFFETYRGPDSFEALSNKWLAPEETGATHLVNNGLMHRESSNLPPMQYSEDLMARKGPPSTAAHYNYINQIGSDHSAPPQEYHHSHPTHRPPGYPYEPTYESSYHARRAIDDADRRLSASPEFATSKGSYPTDLSGGSQNCNAPVGSYAQAQTGSSGNPGGSPASHRSHAPQSPTPSSASTSTHMHNSHNPNSKRSSSNTLGGSSHNGNLDSRSEDYNQFSVLTSPAHPEGSGSAENSAPIVHGSESDWNSVRAPNKLSPSQNAS